MQTDSSASFTYLAPVSASECTTTGAYAHLPACALDPQGNFAAIGDEYFLEHDVRRDWRSVSVRVRQSMTKRGCPYSTGCPFSTRISFTTPPTSASISFSSFMASMMQSVSPGFTAWPSSTNEAAPGLGER